MFVVHHSQKNEATDSASPKTSAWLRGTLSRASGLRFGALHHLVDVGVGHAVQRVGARCRQQPTDQRVQDQQRIHSSAVGQQHRRNGGDQQELDHPRLGQREVAEERGADSARRSLNAEVAFANAPRR